MTMKMEMKSGGDIREVDQTEIGNPPVKVVKRPFDVAFLMLPDDKMKQHQQKIISNHHKNEYEKFNNNVVTAKDEDDDDDEDEEIEVGNNYLPAAKHPIKFFGGSQKLLQQSHQHQQIFDDPNLIKARNLDELRGKSPEKSAFTKVNLRLSPNLSISPDLTYQSSLSPSPPILTNHRNYQSSIAPSATLFKTAVHPQATYQTAFLPTTSSPSDIIHHENHSFLMAANSKIRPRAADLYQHYQQQHFQSHQQDMGLRIQPHNTTAILTSLLPPSLAALSLPAQNVCAKCNISFRMTSDLVYHMRSHHKNEATDAHKRRREEKLKCPVCAESFRERHHLTRHMTAHQDKDDDEADVKKKTKV